MANTAYQGQFGAAAAAAAMAATIPQGIAYTAKFNMTPPPTQQAPQPGGPHANAADQRVVDAQFAAVEARTDTKFAQLLGEMKLIGQQLTGLERHLGDLDRKIDAVDTHSRNAKAIIITTIIGAAIGIVGLTFAAVSALQGAMGATATAYQSGMAAAEARKPQP